jgi:hypothetical protein
MRTHSLRLLTIAAFLVLSACSSSPDMRPTPVADENGNVGSSCSTEADCVLPMTYAIRSVCPFTVVCSNSKCAVACPIVTHDTNPQGSQSYPETCSADSDCDCSSYQLEMKRCSCVSGACQAIVAE